MLTLLPAWIGRGDQPVAPADLLRGGPTRCGLYTDVRERNQPLALRSATERAVPERC